MHVAVLGAGVVGVTTAYFLLKSGHEVTIIDREDAGASSCSFANGAQLSYSYVDAMASPSFLARIPKLFAGLENGIRLRTPLDRQLLRWGASFLSQCSNKQALANTVANLELAQRSRTLLDELSDDVAGDFNHHTAGKLVLLSHKRDVERAHRAGSLKAGYGCNANVVTMDEAIEIEPAVAKMRPDYAGAVWSPADDVGDAHAFTQNLLRHIQIDPNLCVLLGTSIERLHVEHGRVRGVVTDKGEMDVDAAVVCLGAWSPALLAPHGIKLPILPARGYSVTLPPGRLANSVSITDFTGRFVLSHIGAKIRIAGFADFVGFNTSRDASRIRHLIETAQYIAPDVANFGGRNHYEWGGFRPVTPNGRPIIGPTEVEGVFLNTGHGFFGWTLACASAERVVQQVSDGPVAALAA